MLILMVFSYLVPKEEYKAYMQFFIGIFMVVLFLKPVLEFFSTDNPDFVYEIFENFDLQLEQYEVDMTEEENLFEYFFLERKKE